MKRCLTLVKSVGRVTTMRNVEMESAIRRRNNLDRSCPHVHSRKLIKQVNIAAKR